MRKTERNLEIVKLHKEHPELSLREIGQQFGITASAVHSIIKRMQPYVLCPICGANLLTWQEMGLGEHKHFEEAINAKR